MNVRMKGAGCLDEYSFAVVVRWDDHGVEGLRFVLFLLFFPRMMISQPYKA